MATVTFQYAEDGTPTDVASVVLHDPGGSYGVKRNDTGEAVVSVDTPLVRTGTGVYSYTFAEPAPGLTYTAYIKYTTVDGVTDSFPDTIVGAVTTAAGDYMTIQDAFDALGRTNVITYFDRDGTGTEDVQAEQRAIGQVDTRINSLLRSNGFQTPIANTHPDYPLLTYVAVRWFVNEGYRARGMNDDDKVANKMKALDDDAKAMMRQLLIPGRLVAPRTVRQPTQPTTVTV